MFVPHLSFVVYSVRSVSKAMWGELANMAVKRLASGMILVMTPAASGWAQQPVGSDALRQIAACRDVRDDAARLGCFDRAAGDVTDAQRRGDLVVVDRKAVVARRQRAFGLPAANGLAAADVRGADVKELTGVVRASMPTRTPGRFQFKLADGSTWEMLDPVAPPRAGETATITATRLGGFRAKIGTRHAVMVKRLR